MYESDKVVVDVRIDAMLGELSYDIESAKKQVEACKKAYEEAHELATKAVIASCDAYFELHIAERNLENLESIDKQLRCARTDVDKAYATWLEWRKS